MFKNLFCSIILLAVLSPAGAQNTTHVIKDTTYPIVIKIVPGNYYATHMGLACKQELKLQKKTGLNVFFRLGNKDYVDYLEQKPGTTKRF